MSDAPLLIVGAGGLGRELRWLAEDCGRQVAGYLDDGKPQGQFVGDLAVLGSSTDWTRFPEHECVIAIGDCRRRRDAVMRMRASGAVRFASLVHPSVLRSSSVRIGEGTIICANSLLTVDIEIGRHVFINVFAHVGHDCRIGDFCTLLPKAAVSGAVTLGDGVSVGTNASIREGLTMQSGSMLGMGAVLTRNVEANDLLVGNPARLLKTLPPFQNSPVAGTVAPA